MKLLLTIAVAGLVSTALAVPAAFACGHGMEKMAQIGLSAEQQKQIEKAKTTMIEKLLPLRAQMAVKRAEMKVLWTVENPDRKTIMAKHVEMDTLRQKIQEIRVDFKLAVLKMLSGEQRAKFLMTFGGGRGGCGGGCGCEGGGKGCGMGAGHGMGEGHGMGKACPMHGGAGGK